MIHALVARMVAEVHSGWKVEQGEGIARPEASPPREERAFRVGPAVHDKATGTFQSDVTLFVPADQAISIMRDQRVFRPQKIRGKAILGEIREVRAVLQANGDGAAPRPRLQYGQDALD